MRLRHLISGLALAAAGLPATALAGDFHVGVSYGHAHRPHARRTVVRHVTPHRHGHVRRHVHRHGDRCHRVPGHYRVHKERVYVAGRYEYERIPAVYEDYWDAHRCVWVKRVVRPERVRKIWIPGHYVVQKRKRWVPGRWICHRY